MKTASELNQELPYFTGTMEYHRHGSLMLTDGVKYLADNAECYWLMDIINSILCIPKVKKEAFISITLVKKNNEAKFIATDGNKKLLYTQLIPFTDFPLSEIQLFFSNHPSQRVVMLTSEY